MRSLARISLAVLGLASALALSTVVRADDGMSPPRAKTGTKPAARTAQRPPGSTAWFKNPHLCPECKRAEMKAQGVNIPPPPMVNGTIVMSTPCDVCKLTSITYGQPTITSYGNGSAPVLNGSMVAANASMPGRAVVGGPMAMQAPGYAVIGGEMNGPAEPAPIGVMQARSAPPSAGPGALAGRSASTDRAVMQSSATLGAPNTIAAPGHNRPHVLSHALGLTAIGRGWREERNRHRGETHARISYDAPEAKVTEVPTYVLSRGR